ncbi:MAG: repeat protein [Myxococcales bacterium]|nr:repeat protein [Myxococcales bacterium]
MDRVLARAALGAVLVLAAPALAEPRADYFSRLAAAVRSGLEEAVVARAPRLVPPTPIKVTWKAVRVGSLDLGAPLVALTAGDLDRDGKSELYAVTSREVIAFALDQRKIKELGRVAFGGDRAALSPREVIGTAVVDGSELVAGVSSWAKELRVGWQGKVLVAQPGGAGFLQCPGERAALSPGRNHFGDPLAPVHGVRCRDDLFDAEGHPLRVRAALAGTRLAITVARCSVAGACEPAGTYEYKDYGVAFELADLDRNGTPELIVSGAGAPGDPDAIKVIGLGGEDKKGLFRHRFNGGVAGLAVLDSDGDGAMELVAAVRLVGATRVDLWRFN